MELNNIDLTILCFTYKKKLSMEDLRTEIKIAYKNLLPHIKKLESYGVIIVKDFGRGKKKEITANINDPKVKNFIESLIIIKELF